MKFSSSFFRKLDQLNRFTVLYFWVVCAAHTGLWAADAYWDGSNTTQNGVVDGGTGTWNAADTNWTNAAGNINSAWVGGDNAIFSGTAGTVSLDASHTLGTFRVDTDNYIFELASNRILTFNSFVNTSQLATSVFRAGAFSNRILTLSNSADTDYTGSLQDNGARTLSLIKTGTGALTLSGSNTYSGSITITEGTLIAGSNSAIGDQSGTVGELILNGGTFGSDASRSFKNNLSLAFSSTIAGTGAIDFTGGSTGLMSFSRTLTINNTATTTFSGGILLTTSSFARTLTLSGNGDAVFSGAISTTAADQGITLNRSGGTVTFSGNNSYSGTTTLNAGSVLNIRHANALGGTAGGTSVASGAALQIQGGITTAAEALTLNGSGVSTTGALRNISGNNNYTGAITLGSASRIQSDADTLTLSGGISGSAALTFGGAGAITLNSSSVSTGTVTHAGTGTLTLANGTSIAGLTVSDSSGVVSIGTGTLTLSANSSLTGTIANTSGTISVSSGTLAIGASERIGDNASLVLSGGSFNLAGFNETVNLFNHSASGTLNFSGTADFLFNNLTGTQGGTLSVTNWNASNNHFGIHTSAGMTTGHSFLDEVHFAGFLKGAKIGSSTYGSYNLIMPYDINTWDDEDGTNNWSAAANWLGDTYAAEEIVKFENGVGGTATLDSNQTIQGMWVTTNDGNFTIDGGNTLTIRSGGILKETGNSDVTISANVAMDANQTWTVHSGTGIGLTLSGNLNLNAHTLTLDVTDVNSLGFGRDVLIEGSISGTGGIIKNSAGMLGLSGNNSFDGTVVMNSGILDVRHNNALGSTVGATTMTSSTTLNVNGSGLSIAENFNINGTGFGGNGVIRNTGGSNTLSGAITLAGGSKIRVLTSGQELTLSGTVSGAHALTKDGDGTLVLTGNNTYSGGTTVSVGILKGTSSGIQGNVANSASVIFDQGSDGTYAGVISGTGSVTKQGAGTLTLSNNNTFTGDLVISGGTLLLGTNNAIDTTQVDVRLSNNAKLALGSYNQTLKSIILDGDGVIDMGTGTSTLTLGALDFGSNELHIWNWSGNPWGAGGDQKIIINGAISNGTQDAFGHYENVFFYSDDGNTLWSNSPGVWGGGTIITGNELTPPVPEPATYLIGIALLVSGMIYERKRRKEKKTQKNV